MSYKKITCSILCSLATLAFGNVASAEGGLQSFVLDPMVVTASRIPTTITEAKADISVVTRDDIEVQHIENLEEALRTVPGVQFLNYGSNGLNANLSGIRINGSKDIVILVDGVRVSDFQGSGSSGYMYASLMNNMDNIERVEILRGSAATMYGSGAKGGVINIITRKINDTKTSIDISKGNFSQEAYKLNTQGRRNKLAYNVYYSKSLIGDTKDGDGHTWEGNTNSKSNGIKLNYDFSDQHKMSVNYDTMKSNYRGIDYIYKGPFEGNYETKNLTLKYDFVISEKWSNSLTYRNNNVKAEYGKASESYKYKSDYDYDFISDQVTLNTSRHGLVFGFDYSKGYNNIPTSAGYDQLGNPIKANRSMKNFSYYIQDDWEIIPNVTLSGGIRYDKPEGDAYGSQLDTHTSKSYKLSWDITDNDIIYAGRSDFYILPSMEQLYNDKYGNAKLQPAEGRTTSIGYNKKFDDNNVLTVNYFKTESEKLIGFDSEGNYQNYDNGISRGWNAQYMAQFDDHWSANLGWAHLFYSASGDNYEMGYYPKNLATLGIGYNYDKFTASFTGFYFMRKVNENYADVKGWPDDNYGVYNLSMNYAPTDNLTFYTKIDNIFDKLWAEHTNVVHGGEPGSWYAMPGRSIVVGMQLKF